MEAAGAAITAGLAASAIERRGGQHGDEQHAHGACLNCGATLQGEYCHVCGQPSHISRTLADVWHDFLHGVLHFDTKAWKTLPLLVVRPGTLTHRYIHGQRARYVGPVALFLLTVFVMFFVFALLGDGRMAQQAPLSPSQLAEEAALLDRAEARLAESLAQAQAAGNEDEIASVQTSQRFIARAQEAGRLLPGMRIDETPVGVVIHYAIGQGGGLDPIFDEIRAAHEEGRLTVNTGNAAWDKKIMAKLADPEFAWYKIQNTAYKFSFLLVPLSMPLVWLIFSWKRGVTLFDHSVFVLYSLSFMSLAFLTGMLIGRMGGPIADGVTAALAFAPALHMFFQLKGGYGLGWFSAAWRTAYLLFAAVIVLSVFIVLIFMMGLLG